jgi:hypothetical protein
MILSFVTSGEEKWRLRRRGKIIFEIDYRWIFPAPPPIPALSSCVHAVLMKADSLTYLRENHIKSEHKTTAMTLPFSSAAKEIKYESKFRTGINWHWLFGTSENFRGLWETTIGFLLTE